MIIYFHILRFYQSFQNSYMGLFSKIGIIMKRLSTSFFLTLIFILLAVYIPIAMVPVIIFFLNMIPTHRVLSKAKAQELAAVREQLHKSCRILLECKEKNQETNNIPGEINALAVYEKQLEDTRTWPYNTELLRALFYSIVTPLLFSLVRIAIVLLSR